MVWLKPKFLGNHGHDKGFTSWPFKRDGFQSHRTKICSRHLSFIAKTDCVELFGWHLGLFVDEDALLIVYFLEARLD